MVFAFFAICSICRCRMQSTRWSREILRRITLIERDDCWFFPNDSENGDRILTVAMEGQLQHEKKGKHVDAVALAMALTKRTQCHEASTSVAVVSATLPALLINMSC